MLSELAGLWLPILVSTVVVFVAETFTMFFLPFHKKDCSALPDEDAFCDTVRELGLERGQYMFPFAHSPEIMKSPEWQKKIEQGPVGILNIIQNSSSMTPTLIRQIVLDLGIVVVLAYLAAVALEPGAEYLNVFQIVGTAALLAYTVSHFVYGIWLNFRSRVICHRVIEGIVNALLVAGIFGWLWPA